MQIIDNDGVVAAPLQHRLASSWLFRSLSPAQAVKFQREMRLATYQPDELMFLEGEHGDRAHFICTGRVKTSRAIIDRPRYLRALLGPGDLVGVASFLDSGPRDLTAVAVTKVTTASITWEQLRTWCDQVPAIGLDLARERHARAREFETRALHLALLDASARLAGLLLALARGFGVTEQGVVRVEHHLTQDELAHLIGSSRETVSKTIQQFTTRGWIQPMEGEVWLLKPDLLLRRAR
ncbi:MULTISPECIES: Crp/Fnr family transcriptional regulator [unclassified Crossiella]|uniref:Crp/Fnr family transcriptional regulator n=1 Tax=unclassified Crossiella TaxID=2620835 RepID=UPI001FFF1DD1|nr:MULTISPECIES: Crp/Fnr family transcriptional regulator [unclassified Crossiella]MCK2240684.1 Crp/Fnr family transcriptional regulator [Crossiella sp. S99.2]MCK2252865.1 Crp/Fnr family transcriptional regulator [Crossiella sp. S99.1]